MPDQCYIKGCQKSKGLREITFYGKKVKMCPGHAEANKYAK